MDALCDGQPVQPMRLRGTLHHQEAAMGQDKLYLSAGYNDAMAPSFFRSASPSLCQAMPSSPL